MKRLPRRMVFCALCLLLPITHGSAQSKDKLLLADALFRKKQYTESFAIYDSLLRAKTYTPSMLLKMAYIQEGLEAVGKSQYYLNLYFLASNDRSALDKLENMALKYNLSGYEQSDVTFARMFFEQYKINIEVGILAICVFLLAMMVYQKRSTGQLSKATFAILIFFVMVLIFVTNASFRTTPVIVASSHTYLMSAPSAGSSVVDVIGEGNRLMVNGKNDVWLHVNWDGKDAFINRNRVLEVVL